MQFLNNRYNFVVRKNLQKSRENSNNSNAFFSVYTVKLLIQARSQRKARGSKSLVFIQAGSPI